jgi:hypothetical protein
LLAFSIGHDPAHNFLLKRGCCRFAQAIGVTSDPRITFPYLLKNCASTLGLCAAPMVPGRRWHHSVEDPINLRARRSIRTHQRRRRDQTVVEPGAPSTPTPRDFVHWRFSYACRRSAWIGSSRRRPKTFTEPDGLNCSGNGLLRSNSNANTVTEVPLPLCRLSGRAWSKVHQVQSNQVGLVLLRHKLQRVRPFILRRERRFDFTPQHGQRDRMAARLTIRRRRMVAMEFGT